MGIEIILAVTVAAVLLIGGGLWLEGRGRKSRAPQPERVELLTSSPTSRTPKSVKAVFLLVPLAIIGLGVLILVIAMLWRMEYEASDDWATTQGVVSKSDVTWKQHRPIADQDDDDKYKIKFEYRYQVDNVLYTSKRIYFSFAALMDITETRRTLAAAEKLIKPYPVGQTVTVRYDPDNPKKAVLERRFDNKSFLMGLGVGLLAVVIGLGAVIFGLFELLSDRRVYIN